MAWAVRIARKGLIGAISGAAPRERSLERMTEREWNDSQPIYRQLRDLVVAMILDRVLKEGDPLPSVRNVAAEYRVNPLTVLKGYQQLVDERLIKGEERPRHLRQCRCARPVAAGESPAVPRRGVAQGLERRIRRLGLSPKELLEAAATHPLSGSLEGREGELDLSLVEEEALARPTERPIALDGVDLRVEEGRILGIVGPNGAGKSTALHAAVGSVPLKGELQGSRARPLDGNAI